MADTGNRIRQARRHIGLTQLDLANRVGVHRSAVAQWEQVSGSHPTMENLARIALTTSVCFEWLATGRGRMEYRSDLLASEQSPALLLEHSAQSETEVRALMALRRIEFSSVVAIVEMAEALGEARQLKLKRKTPYAR